MEINKLIKYSMLSLAVLSSGCTTTSNRQIIGGDIIDVRSRVDVQTPSLYKRNENHRFKPDMDNLLNEVRELDRKLANYSRLETIINEIKRKNFDRAHIMFRSLAKGVEREGDKELLSKLKEFSYIKYEYVSEELEVKDKSKYNPIEAVFIYGIGVIAAPIAVLDGQEPVNFFKEKVHKTASEDSLISKRTVSKTVKEAYYRKKLVNPYYGTEKVIDEFVSLSEVK